MLLNLYNIVVNYVRINSIYFGKSCTVYSMYNAHFEFRVSLKSRDEAIRGCILVKRGQNLKRHNYFCNFLRIY